MDEDRSWWAELDPVTKRWAVARLVFWLAVAVAFVLLAEHSGSDPNGFATTGWLFLVLAVASGCNAFRRPSWAKRHPWG